jgi:hypothetical protein
MSDTAFVLLNCNLIAVPLQLGCAGAVTIYCGARRASQLLGKGGALSDARRPGCTAEGEATTARSDGGNKSNVETRPPVAREMASQRSAGAWPFFSHL